MVCSAKDPQGTPHFRLGMVRPITVTPDSSGAPVPAADVELELSDYVIATRGELSSGGQTVAIHFGSREREMGPPYQSIHLVRMEEGTSVDDVGAWMDAYRAPAAAQALGGAIAMPAGNTVYLTVDLEPGRYAWVSNATAAKGTLKEFTVE